MDKQYILRDFVEGLPLVDTADMLHNDIILDDIMGGGIIVYAPRVYVPAIGVTIADGTYCNYDNDDGWMGDFAVTLIYPQGGGAPYWEQDGAAESLYNYLYFHRALGDIKSPDELLDLDIIIMRD